MSRVFVARDEQLGRDGRRASLLYDAYIAGESLRARIDRGSVPIAEAVSVLRDVAAALEHAHARGIVHRDIKPENVLISGRTAVVTDRTRARTSACNAKSA